MTPSDLRPPAAGRGLVRVLAATLLAAWLSSGSCSVHYSGCTGHCRDKDHDHDGEDDGGSAGLTGGPFDPERYRLASFAWIPAEDPHAHPFRRVHDVEGPAALPGDGLRSPTGEDFALFTARVIAAQPGVLGLAPSAGRLTYAGTATFDAGPRVAWRQEVPAPGGGWTPLPGARVLFLFDPVGRLRAVDNTTRTGR